jgi:hemerythrin-like domain-containing protein
MLIYEELKKDHEKVKSQLIKAIRDELIPHARAEEAVFYNTLRSIDSAKDIVMHGYQEHLEAETQLRMLQLRDKIDVEWKETAQKLKSAVEHHIQEEEGKIFNVAKQLFTNDEAVMMGDAFTKLKPDIKEEGFLSTTLDMVVNMMPPRFSKVFRTNNLERRV